MIKKNVHLTIAATVLSILLLTVYLAKNDAPPCDAELAVLAGAEPETVLAGAEPETVLAGAEPETVLVQGTVQSGDTLEQILADKNISRSEIIGIVNSLNREYNVKKIKPGQRYELFTLTCGSVYKFNYWLSKVEHVNIKRLPENGLFYAVNKTVPSEKIVTTISGEVKSNLYESIIAAGGSAGMVMEIADIFSWQIDFFAEPRSGDKFQLAYEQHRFANGVMRDGRILIASYTGERIGKQLGIYFENSEGIGGYYDLKGNSMRKKFLRSPLNYTRISSHFTHSRFHPILRRWMPSLAVDYAAPLGTPVVSVAGGTVTFAGWGQTPRRRGLGIHVIIRHNSVYATWYSHLSQVARGIKNGRRVEQGQVIGYVGSTGLSTGPHLDFRVKRHGEFVNFLELESPHAKEIAEEYRDEFEKTAAKLLTLLNATTL